MPFLPPNQQHQSTEGISYSQKKNGAKLKLLFHRSYDTAGWMTGRATRRLERSLMKKLAA